MSTVSHLHAGAGAAPTRPGRAVERHVADVGHDQVGLAPSSRAGVAGRHGRSCAGPPPAPTPDPSASPRCHRAPGITAGRGVPRAARTPARTDRAPACPAASRQPRRSPEQIATRPPRRRIVSISCAERTRGDRDRALRRDRLSTQSRGARKEHTPRGGATAGRAPPCARSAPEPAVVDPQPLVARQRLEHAHIVESQIARVVLAARATSGPRPPAARW